MSRTAVKAEDLARRNASGNASEPVFGTLVRDKARPAASGRGRKAKPCPPALAAALDELLDSGNGVLTLANVPQSTVIQVKTTFVQKWIDAQAQAGNVVKVNWRTTEGRMKSSKKDEDGNTVTDPGTELVTVEYWPHRVTDEDTEAAH